MTEKLNPFSLPPDGEVFTNDILERSSNLIDSGIWEGLESVRLRLWMRNFASPEERYFAANILDALIYRSSGQTIAMMEHLFDRTIPDLLRVTPPPDGPNADWGALLRLGNKEDPGIRIVPVIRDIDPPTKSGPLMARLYRRHLAISDHWMIWPWQLRDSLSSSVNKVLFIDDFLGTGTQFIRFIEFFGLTGVLTNAYVVYAPLVAHREGITNVVKKFPNVRIAAVETLEPHYGLFSPDSLYFQDGINSPASAGGFYETLVDARLPKLREKYRGGWGSLQLAYAFSHAIPNNCLPILWMKTDNWNSLFER